METVRRTAPYISWPIVIHFTTEWIFEWVLTTIVVGPVMKMFIFLTVSHTFLRELVTTGKIVLISRHLILGDHFLYSHHLNV